MDRIAKEIHRYCSENSTPISPLLKELERETYLKTLAPQMISGPLQGTFLSMLSQLIQPNRILEIGTFTGYATICLATGLQSTGQIDTIEVNKELAYLIRKYVKKAAIEERVNLHIGDALEIIPGLDGPFDLVFIDAGKRDYQAFFDLTIDKVRSGGIILADNVLWDSKVLFPAKDKPTAYLQSFNKQVTLDERVENLLLPLRDGLMVMRKI